MIKHLSIGQRLSRELTPIAASFSLELLPIIDARARLLIAFDAHPPLVVDRSHEEWKDKACATEKTECTLRDALSTSEVTAYVHHPDGRLFRVPACYWGSFHDYRPLNGEGLFTQVEHGQLAFLLNEQGVFSDAAQADAKWPFQTVAIMHGGHMNRPLPRAPSFKAGRPPPADEILRKADEMKARGLDGRTIAKVMRSEPGFENVANTEVRILILGRWKSAGRPKKAAR